MFCETPQTDGCDEAALVRHDPTTAAKSRGGGEGGEEGKGLGELIERGAKRTTEKETASKTVRRGMLQRLKRDGGYEDKVLCAGYTL